MSLLSFFDASVTSFFARRRAWIIGPEFDFGIGYKDVPTGVIRFLAFILYDPVITHYIAKAVQASAQFIAELLDVLSAYQHASTELSKYTLLLEPNDGGLLYVPSMDTQLGQLTSLLAQPADENLVESSKHLANISGYALKVTTSGKVLYCVKKTLGAWRTKENANFMSVVFREHEFELIDDTTFRLERAFDFFGCYRQQGQ